LIGLDFSGVALIMPVFNDRESCKMLLRDIGKISAAKNWNFCLVDDGSLRNAPETIDLNDAGLSGVVLRLHRNVGHQPALACGLGYACDQWKNTRIVLLDSDGEDRPEDILQLLEKLDSQKNGAMVAARRRRSESLSFQVFYMIYKFLFRALTGNTIRFGNFMALSPLAAKRLSAMNETWVHVAASLIASRTPIALVETDRGNRYAGNSTMNFVSLAIHGMRATMVFADAVFMRMIILSILIIFGSATFTTIAIAIKFLGFASPGWLTTVLGSTASIMIQVASLAAVSLVLAGIKQSDTPQNVSKKFQEYIASVEKT
jgi:polyisoprenyl-phosphate glycosyltransferase